MPKADSGAASDGGLLEVLWGHLGRRGEGAQNARGRLEAFRAWRRRGASDLDHDVAALFGLIAVGPSDLGGLMPGLRALLGRGVMRDLPRDAIPTVFQAYVRGVGRIAAAEAEIARGLLVGQPSEAQARILDETLDGLVPLASKGFDLLHQMLLLDALVEVVAGIEDPGGDDPMAIAMVDLVGSTRYLTTSGPGELERLVDALFEAGQAATAHRSVHVVKYVGDGLFVAGRDVCEVADVALQVVRRLEEVLPLRARGGLAWGAVVQRAGDVFGLPINVAHIATRAARPGTVLATSEAAALLPPSRRGRYRTIQAAHPVLDGKRVATVRAVASTDTGRASGPAPAGGD
jgi:class 3 adenylate cyclase